jgi:hypothetical protein
MSPSPQLRSTTRFWLFLSLVLLGMVVATLDATRAQASAVFDYDGSAG